MICHNLAVKMSVSTGKDAINAQCSGGDVELVLDELRNAIKLKKFLGGKQSTDRMHDVPKSCGNLVG